MVRSLKFTVKDIALCVGSAALLILSFPLFDLGFLAWVGFVPLFFALRNTSWRRAFLLTYLTGVIFWSGVIYWLAHVTLLGTVVLILYLALYFGLFGLFASSFLRRPSPASLFLVPAAWVFLEYLRSYLLTGFPWALLGYSQYRNLPVIQIADTTGPWGVSFLVMMLNVVLYLFFDGTLEIRQKRKVAVAALVTMAAVLGHGYYTLKILSQENGGRPLRISVIQGNIPQELKWDPAARAAIIKKYELLSQEAARDVPGLLIWPEAALPVIAQEEPYYYRQVLDFAKRIAIPVLLGAVTMDGERYYNSALLISGRGELTARYNKMHLVPFGEYIPLKKIFPFLQSIAPIGDITPGKSYAVFKVQEHSKIQDRFSVLICFEDLFPKLSRVFVRQGAGFLVNITNDAWYKQTSAAAQHLCASVFRAVENKVPLVRSANTGISAFIDRNGAVVSRVQGRGGNDIFVDGFRTRSIVLQAHRLTRYALYGDFFIAVCLILTACGIMMRVVKPKTP